MTKSDGWTRRLVALARLGRPKFLLGGFALFGLGTLSAYFMGFGFNPRSYLWGQLAVLAIQLMTHYSNDFFDLEADRANHTPTKWSGGSRVLVRGELPRWVALAAAIVLVAVALFAIIALCTMKNMPQILVLAVFGGMLLLSWSYSSPPLRLHSRGLGEATVALVVPFLTPVSGFVVQAKSLHIFPVLLTLPLIGLQLVMLLTLQIPDARGDRKVGKLTWTVLFGVRTVAVLCSVLILLSFGVAFWVSYQGAPASLRWFWLCLVPVAIYQLANYRANNLKRPSAFNRIAFGSVALFFLAIAADLLGLVVAGDGA